MKQRFRWPYLLFSGPCLTMTFAGCRPEVPVPATPATPKSTTTSQSAVPPLPTEAPFLLESDFVPLPLDQFESFGADSETWQTTTEGIRCSGKPRGYLYSKQPYRNFVLRLDYRFPRPDNLKDEAKFKGNTGFLVYITGEHKVWPTCIEVQGKHVQMASIKENGDAEKVITEDDDAARKKSRKSVGEWNSLEITSKNGALNVSLNGTPINHSQAGALQEGLIGIQAEEHPFEVRRMRIFSHDLP